MKTLISYIRLYFLIVSQYIKVRLQYRTDFLLSSVGSLAEMSIGIFSIWIVFKSIPALEGYSFHELLFIYGYSILALLPKQMLFDNIWSLGFKLREGNFIKYYFRPLNIMFYYMSEVFDLKGVAQFFIGSIALIYSSIQLSIEWSLLKVALFLLTMFSSSLIMVSLMVIAGSTGFWTTDPFSILMFTHRFSEFARYPVSIFNEVVKFLFTYILPISFIAFYPSQLFLRPESPSMLIWFSPFAGIILFIIAYQVWTRGVNSYAGTGS